MSRAATNKRDISISHNAHLVTLTEDDIDVHYLNLDILGENIVKILVTTERTSGTGYLYMYPNDGTQNVIDYDTANTPSIITPISITNNHLKYKLTVANDVFNVHCFGYTKQLSMMQRDIR